jgi:hypothetical protein
VQVLLHLEELLLLGLLELVHGDARPRATTLAMSSSVTSSREAAADLERLRERSWPCLELALEVGSSP